MNVFKPSLALALFILATFVGASEAKYKLCPCTRNVTHEQSNRLSFHFTPKNSCRHIKRELLVFLSRAIGNVQRILRRTDTFTSRQCSQTTGPLGDLLGRNDNGPVTNCPASFTRMSQLYNILLKVDQSRKPLHSKLLSNLKTSMCNLEVLSYYKDGTIQCSVSAREVDQVAASLARFNDMAQLELRNCVIARDTMSVLQAVKRTCVDFC